MLCSDDCCSLVFSTQSLLAFPFALQYVLANVNREGVHITEPYELPTRWDYSLFVDPKA